MDWGGFLVSGSTGIFIAKIVTGLFVVIWSIRIAQIDSEEPASTDATPSTPEKDEKKLKARAELSSKQKKLQLTVWILLVAFIASAFADGYSLVSSYKEKIAADKASDKAKKAQERLEEGVNTAVEKLGNLSGSMQKLQKTVGQADDKLVALEKATTQANEGIEKAKRKLDSQYRQMLTLEQTQAQTNTAIDGTSRYMQRAARPLRPAQIIAHFTLNKQSSPKMKALIESWLRLAKSYESSRDAALWREIHQGGDITPGTITVRGPCRLISDLEGDAASAFIALRGLLFQVGFPQPSVDGKESTVVTLDTFPGFGVQKPPAGPPMPGRIVSKQSEAITFELNRRSEELTVIVFVQAAYMKLHGNIKDLVSLSDLYGQNLDFQFIGQTAELGPSVSYLRIENDSFLNGMIEEIILRNPALIRKSLRLSTGPRNPASLVLRYRIPNE